jgi:ubiquinone biosynthesis protein Coq4
MNYRSIHDCLYHVRNCNLPTIEELHLKPNFQFTIITIFLFMVMLVFNMILFDLHLECEHVNTQITRA